MRSRMKNEECDSDVSSFSTCSFLQDNLQITVNNEISRRGSPIGRNESSNLISWFLSRVLFSKEDIPALVRHRGRKIMKVAL